MTRSPKLLTDRGAGGRLARRLVPLALIAPSAVAWAELEGQRRGLFTPETGLGILVAFTSASLLLGAFWCSRLLGITEREREATRDRIREMSLTDELTQLRNRRAFLDVAGQQILVARRFGQPMLLFSMDLGGLRQINAEQGHEAGDRAIRDFATVLRASFRESDVIARLGGDEFAVLAINTVEAQRIEFLLTEALGRYNDGPDRSFKLAASIGVAFCNPASRVDVASLLREADAKRQEQKTARRAGGEGASAGEGEVTAESAEE